MSVDVNGLGLEWPEHDAPCEGTSYSWEWLDAHRTEPEAVEGRRPTTRRWRATDLARDGATVSYNEVMDTADGLKRFLEIIEEVGVGFLSDCPTELGTVTGIASRLGFVENSHFGGRFDVESKPAAENLAYTAVALFPHNDLPSREHLPGVQLLLCLENAATGGESILVDALAAAERLRTEDPASFDLLVSTPVTFTSIAATWHIVNRAPIIATDSDGRITGTRFHPALIGPVDVAPDVMGDFYTAHRALLDIVTDPSMQYTFRLEPGDCQIFDNQRILHARWSFDPNSGPRHLEGCYVPLDEIKSALAIARRDGAPFRQI